MFPKTFVFAFVLFGLIINSICTPPHSPQPSTSSSNNPSKKDCCNGANVYFIDDVKSLSQDRQQKAVNSFLESVDNSEIFIPEWRVSQSESRPDLQKFDGMKRCSYSSCVGMKFRNKFQLDEHNRQTHPGDRPFNCEICRVNFSDNIDLKNHVKRLHKNTRPWQCRFCKNKFINAQNMNRHMGKMHYKKQ